MAKPNETQEVLKTMTSSQVLTIDKTTGRRRVQTFNKEPTKTQQQFAAECDVNNIMKKYLQTGEIHHINRKTGVYADLSMITDYRDMLETVRHAQSAFAELPAEVRREFDHDPQKLIDFLGDKKNLDKAIELGLVEKKESISSPLTQNQNTKTESVTPPPTPPKA